MFKINKDRCIRKQVINQLRHFVLSGKIAPGERLYEENLAAGIGSRRTPIREVLHVLEREGLVNCIDDSKPGIKERRGFYGMRRNVELGKNDPKKFRFSNSQELIVQTLRQ